MPRIARDYSKIKVYHITIRGIDKQNIFFDEKDKNKFIEIVKSAKEKYEFDIYAYCLMDNHVHIVIYDKNEMISKIMQSIQISYVIYFNKKYERIGHLFQDRFFSKKVENREYLKMLCRYIHQNPLKAGISKTEEYKWSSYQKYIKFNKLVDTKLLLSIFSQNIEEAKKEFIKFHNMNFDESKENEIKDMLEYEVYERLTDQQIEKCICEILNMKCIQEISRDNMEIRNEKLSKLKCLKNVSVTQLSRVMGINRKMIERAIKE